MKIPALCLAIASLLFGGCFTADPDAALRITSTGRSSIQGAFHRASSTLLFYSWAAKVDGRALPVSGIKREDLGTYPLSPGLHSIEVRFHALDSHFGARFRDFAAELSVDCRQGTSYVVDCSLNGDEVALWIAVQDTGEVVTAVVKRDVSSESMPLFIPLPGSHK
jgi:hypothetical protein